MNSYNACYFSAEASEDAFDFPRNDAYSARMAGQFLQLKRDGELTDFTIQCGEKSFQCHKVILAACSPVLKAMIMSDMAETTKQQVQLDIPSDIMQLLLDYMYTGDASVPNKLLQSTIKACDYLQLMELKMTCLTKAATVCAPDNVISWFKLAESLNMDYLKAKCSDILASSLADVAKGLEFLELSLAEVSSYMNDVQETKVDPDDLLDATVGWVDHKPSTRQEHMMGMVQHIDLSGCSLECLNDVIEDHAALLQSQLVVFMAFTKGMSKVANQDPVRRKRNPKRNGKTKIAIIGGYRKLSWYLDPSMQLVELCAIPDCCDWYSACQVPQGFVVTGGVDSVLCTMFVSATKSWKPLVPLSVARYAHGSIFMHGKIYLLGGHVNNTVSKSVQSLALDGGTWKDEPELPQYVYLAEASCMGGNLFLLEIWNNNHLFCLDVERKIWSEKATCPINCRGARMTTAQDQLFVAGGNSKTLSWYGPVTDTWQTGNPPMLQHYLGALICHDQKLYLIGGKNESRAEEYNLDTQTWSMCDFKLPYEVSNLQAVALDM